MCPTVIPLKLPLGMLPILPRALPGFFLNDKNASKGAGTVDVSEILVKVS